jgi:hypothetical protein
MQQQLAWVDQAPLYQIYLDLRKAYDALDRGRCLEILAGYGVGPNLLCLQKKFWDKAKMVCRAGGNYGLPFGAHRGVTQGGPLSSLMFNVCVDCVVREWLRQVLGDNVAQGGVGNLVSDQCIAFFVNDGLVAARYPEWLQTSFDILITLFEQISLRTNAKKTKVMTCYCRGRYELPRWKKCMQASRRCSGHQRRSIDALIARSVVPALRLNPSEAIWRPSTTSSGCLYSTGTLS